MKQEERLFALQEATRWPVRIVRVTDAQPFVTYAGAGARRPGSAQ